jgi:Arc/MetJ-type ribon-helix-helix transcriptional regulator
MSADTPKPPRKARRRQVSVTLSPQTEKMLRRAVERGHIKSVSNAVSNAVNDLVSMRRGTLGFLENDAVRRELL